MGRAQFEYDEVGNTFYYVLIAFYTVLLLPLTHFLWPSAVKVESKTTGCQCEGDRIKRKNLLDSQPKQTRKRILKSIILLMAWGFLFYLGNKVSQIEVTHEEYDPYKVLGLDQGAGVSEIKKAYHKLSKQYHPDRGGDEEQFNHLAKAYQALTNEESRENWEKYGNPDGPRATTFGIALPKWIVSENYGNWVLAFYGLVFMILMPSAVGYWWYNSIKYSADKVLLETTKTFAHFISKTPNMEVTRVLMVLTASCEFWRKFNNEIVESEEDDVELPVLMKEFKNLGENKKEIPFSQPYSVKCRILLYAYLSRLDLNSARLERDQTYMVSRVLPLLDEFMRLVIQFTFNGWTRHTPTINTIENVLKLYPMFVQALWQKNSPLMQLPHLTEQNIAYLRRNRVYTPQDLAQLNELKRRALLNHMEECDYNDIITVLHMMPKLLVETRIEVQGEDDCDTVTVGSVVTIKIHLTRLPLLDLDNRLREIEEGAIKKEKMALETSLQPEQPKKKPWEKQKPKKKPGKVKRIGKANKKRFTNEEGTEETKKEDNKEEVDKKQKNNRPNESDEGSEYSDSGSESNESYDSDKSLLPDESESDDDWGDDEVPLKKEALLESEPTDHHEVHCPLFPQEKHEWWYLYLIEKRTKNLASLIIPCKTLNTEKTLEMRISAPPEKGVYNFTLHIKSDSYLDFDYSQDVKMEVQNAREPNVIVYGSSEEEEEREEVLETSDDYTEGSASENED
ncbi:unnamed protein product [Bursaphelenchus xylophilus]|uniref:(pine wood nematode) hypothetical protein n=1 Tax=Bursaphelenchus xylophilus TaxID=6326 RepID=A0A1I7S783_BURXY|nr:unnamed protein product [Bursaphelenchus xylophilus]CAG9084740.1 unnamed protein product [Bursaphelenchus xylophilus]